MQRQANDVALVPEALDAVHQLPHQEESPAFLFSEVFLGSAIPGALIEVEPRPLVNDLENEIFVADDRSDAHLLAAGRHVASEDGVRERLRQCDGYVERAFGGGQFELAAALPRELHYTFYVFYVARDLKVERDARFSH